MSGELDDAMQERANAYVKSILSLGDLHTLKHAYRIVSTNPTDTEGNTLLHHAARKGHPHIIK